MDQRCLCHLPGRYLVLLLLADWQPSRGVIDELECPHLLLSDYLCGGFLFRQGAACLRWSGYACQVFVGEMSLAYSTANGNRKTEVFSVFEALDKDE